MPRSLVTFIERAAKLDDDWSSIHIRRLPFHKLVLAEFCWRKVLAGLAKVSGANPGKNAMRLRHGIDRRFKAAVGKENASPYGCIQIQYCAVWSKSKAPWAQAVF
jgi:hypothetical protein